MVKISGGSGMSYDEAIIMTDCSHIEGIDQEYIELRKRFGGWRL
jgi:hypothetical protein